MVVGEIEQGRRIRDEMKQKLKVVPTSIWLCQDVANSSFLFSLKYLIGSSGTVVHVAFVTI